MFCLLQLTPPSRWTQVRAKPCVSLGIPYRLLTVTPRTGGALPWHKIARTAGASPLVLPRGIDPPTQLEVFGGTALRRIWMTAAVLRTVQSIPPEKRRVAIYDRDAVYPETVLNLAKHAGELLVVTDRRGGFETVSRTVMARYGAALNFVSPTAARTAQAAVAPAGLWVNLPRPPRTFSGADCDFENVFDGYLPPRPLRIPNASPRLYDALFQLGRCHMLAQVFPDAVCSAGKTLDITRAV